jgi:hypothetical protein
MYSEFATDPKVQMLSEAMQRRLMMLFCLRCSNNLVTLHETEIAFQLRITDEQLAETKALFISKKFIDKSWNVLNWEKRQFASDSSKNRVAKHRALLKEKHEAPSNADVTLQKPPSNAIEQNRTDTEQIQKIDGSAKRRTQIPADFEPNETGRQTAVAKGVQVATELVKFIDFHTAKGSVMLDWQAAWRTWVGNARPQPQQANGETAYQRAQREKMQLWAPGVAAKVPNFSNPITLEDVSNVAAIEGR